ncbi:STAS domain-containing protein [Occallatibacter riparius]|uniref:STAS domain-containing protein n=1 Tax=Occallatibacter riparius TaxID=1002689 RepID=A0A9J7BKR8_9BACT|nr:STAS domain-containing protein [Occallatibacter riparius]UWZ83424.1 STAS domain-containing protein [Occallatibacter riparius]
MQITEHPGAELVELRLTGRIDATWAEHLSSTIENAVRGGAHRVVLNFAGVEYISSLGIRVLLVQYKLLKSVKGSLIITHASDFCRNVFTTVGLGELLSKDDPAAAPAPLVAPKQRRSGADYEIYPQQVVKRLTCAMIGDPSRLTTAGFTSNDCRPLTFATGSFGIGLGAFGQGYDDCANRFGEFLAAGGCAIALPTSDRHALPDYVVEEGTLVPQVETLYALSGAGDFSTMIRFDSTSDGPGKIGLTELVDNLVDISTAETIAFVVLAEAAGLVGATLRKSPAGQPLVQTLPGVRDWLSFTTERSSEKTLCLLVGVAARSTGHTTAKFLRPLKTDSAISAHIHAAVFPYRPVQRGELPFGKTVADLLNASSPNAVLHLMADTRPFEGVGETDLARGACWIGPISQLTQG